MKIVREIRLDALDAIDAHRINIYDASRLVGWIEGDDRAAWQSAVEVVRGLCHADGVTGAHDGWYRTANRIGYAKGIFRAIDGNARQFGCQRRG